MNAETMESAIDDFKEWYAEWNQLEESEFPDPSVDFAAIVAGFTSLRHEVNLQTRATRSAVDQSAEMLKLIDSQRSKNDASSNESSRPYIKAMVDIYDQLALAAVAIEKKRESNPPQNPLPPSHEPGFLAKLLGAKLPIQPLAKNADAINATIEALLSGYRMSLSRIDKLLAQNGLLVIPTQGLPFDAEIMEAVEVDENAEAISGTVTMEIRRGYHWNGKLFRCAQVRVVR